MAIRRHLRAAGGLLGDVHDRGGCFSGTTAGGIARPHGFQRAGDALQVLAGVGRAAGSRTAAIVSSSVTAQPDAVRIMRPRGPIALRFGTLVFVESPMVRCPFRQEAKSANVDRAADRTRHVHWPTGANDPQRGPWHVQRPFLMPGPHLALLALLTKRTPNHG